MAAHQSGAGGYHPGDIDPALGVEGGNLAELRLLPPGSGHNHQKINGNGGSQYDPNNLLIEYSAHIPYTYSTREAPILSSLTNQSLLHQRQSMEQLQRSMEHQHSAAVISAAVAAQQQHRSLDQANLYSTPLLAEPISPPRQFDSSPQPATAGIKPNRHGVY
jgi:hypothetical protein